MSNLKIIQFPKQKIPTPDEIKAIKSVRANQLIRQFIEVCEIKNKQEQIDAFSGLRVSFYDYFYFEMDKGLQS